MISFTVHGTPKPQPRPRAYVRGKRAGVYDPGTAHEWKHRVGKEAEKHAPAEPLTGALWVSLTFYMPRPKGHFGTGRNAGKLKSSAPRHHTSRPDVDNLAKAVLDAMSEAGVWKDDDQIVRLDIDKQYGEREGVYVRVKEPNA